MGKALMQNQPRGRQASPGGSGESQSGCLAERNEAPCRLSRRDGLASHWWWWGGRLKQVPKTLQATETQVGLGASGTSRSFIDSFGRVLIIAPN